MLTGWLAADCSSEALLKTKMLTNHVMGSFLSVNDISN